MSEVVYVSEIKRPQEIPFLIRVLWFFVFGLELTAVWILVAWALNATIIGLPFGLWMIDRVPQVLTLKARPGAWVVNKGGSGRYLPEQQTSWLVRGLYFVFIGWWLSLLWATIAYTLCATILGLPLGVLMLHGLPAVTTLQKG
jgi:uncharacterized membrane protein YccF (DUF307 family)